MTESKIYRWSKKLTPFVLYGFFYTLISRSINRFSNLFHSLNQENIRNNTAAKDPTTHQVCRYTTLWNVSVLKATTENKTSSVTTHFKKLTTGNNVFIVLVITVSKVTDTSRSYSSNVQCIHLAAVRRTLKMRFYRTRLVFSCCF